MSCKDCTCKDKEISPNSKEDLKLLSIERDQVYLRDMFLICVSTLFVLNKAYRDVLGLLMLACFIFTIIAVIGANSTSIKGLKTILLSKKLKFSKWFTWINYLDLVAFIFFICGLFFYFIRIMV